MIKLQKLPYDQSCLIDKLSLKTFDFHYNQHHRGYVDKLNTLILNTQYDNQSLRKIILNSYRNNDVNIYHNAAQIWNHDFYWQSLSNESNKPLKIMHLIQQQYGDLDTFYKQFIEAGITLFGSGWIWLVLDKNNRLSILKTKNADNPLITNTEALLTIDVWEHAYYIDCQNRRIEYLEKIISCLNWQYAEDNYDKITSNNFK